MQANFVASDLQDPLGTETRPYAETRAESRTHCQSLAVMHLVIIYSEDELSRSRSLSIFCVANITFGIGLARVRPFFRQRKKFFHCPSRWVWIMRRVDIVYLLHAPCPHRDDENLFSPHYIMEVRLFFGCVCIVSRWANQSFSDISTAFGTPDFVLRNLRDRKTGHSRCSSRSSYSLKAREKKLWRVAPRG